MGLTDRLVRPLVLRLLGGWRQGRLRLTLPDGAVHEFGNPAGPVHELQVVDNRFFSRLLVSGVTGVGESYMAGEWHSEDLPGLIAAALANADSVRLDGRFARLSGRLDAYRQHRRANSPAGSQDNIHEHYDLGNDFFRLFLDDTLTYSCAVYADESQSQANAQINKYRVICDQLNLGPEDRVLEIGCGWGGFALYAARETGCHVTGITISREQLALARERVAAACLEGQIDIQYRDYRDLDATYDAVVSIEMFEAVGREYWDTYFRAAARALRPGGRFLLQTIATPDVHRHHHRRGSGWISKYIFPGGILPAVVEIRETLARTSPALHLAAEREIGPHYIRTLDTWRGRFWDKIDAVRALGYDERFIRMWDFYLASCSAAFTARHIRDVQLLLTRDPAPVAESA
ncbi:MAG: cyclopropane-fatty-acyl-phospholipid synthase family protein [Chloroflexota bacterium]|nr:cyclopropane-fatty-acyl-phospholipid synthase family protein [Chloroflexota bacterium]